MPRNSDRDRIEELEATLADIKDKIEEVLDSESDEPRRNPLRR